MRVNRGLPPHRQHSVSFRFCCIEQGFDVSHGFHCASPGCETVVEVVVAEGRALTLEGGVMDEVDAVVPTAFPWAMGWHPAENVRGGDCPDRPGGEWRGIESRVAVPVEGKEQRACGVDRRRYALRERLALEVLLQKIGRGRPVYDSEDCRPTSESGDGADRAVVGGTKDYEVPGADLDAVRADHDLGSIKSCDERKGEAGAG